MLVAEGLVKAYRGTPVVQDVSLQLTPGHVLGLVGANGAGKTTTMKMLAGLVAPTEGIAELDGRPTRVADVRRDIGFLPEDSPLYDEETPISYLRFFGAIYDVDKATVDQRSRTLLDRLGLDRKHWEKPTGKMSKGMRRKVAIARCVLHDPDVLILDEPTSGLDPLTERDLNRFIAELRDDGKAILLSAHNLRQVEELCDEIVVMHEGRVATRGTLSELRDRWGTRAYHLRSTVPFPGSNGHGNAHEARFEDLADLETALEHIREQDGMVLEMESIAPKLEDILVETARG